MNIASILVLAGIALLLASAVRYIVKNGPCAACGDAKACGKASGGDGCAHCAMSGSCHSAKAAGR